MCPRHGTEGQQCGNACFSPLAYSVGRQATPHEPSRIKLLYEQVDSNKQLASDCRVAHRMCPMGGQQGQQCTAGWPACLADRGSVKAGEALGAGFRAALRGHRPDLTLQQAVVETAGFIPDSIRCRPVSGQMLAALSPSLPPCNSLSHLLCCIHTNTYMHSNPHTIFFGCHMRLMHPRAVTLRPS